MDNMLVDPEEELMVAEDVYNVPEFFIVPDILVIPDDALVLSENDADSVEDLASA